MKEAYRKQVALLLDILPEVAKEEVFALHGGTAINLFHLDMPRLSIDIDLTFIPATLNREEDLSIIRSSLNRIKERLRKQLPRILFSDQIRAEEELKLICTVPDAIVKIEVNQINRGLIGEPEIMMLCENAQETFDKFCEMKIVSRKQLWGGKIHAALDRQHPRDLFDIKNFIERVDYTQEIKEGIIFFLISSKRPFHELLNPRPIKQFTTFESEFKGMSDKSFEYDEYESTREWLIKTVNGSLTIEDKRFLISFAMGEPDWSKMDYSNYPAVKWRLLNIDKLKDNNPQKHREQRVLLEKVLSR